MPEEALVRPGEAAQREADRVTAIYEARKRLIQERALEIGVAQYREPVTPAMVDGIQCEHCNESYEVGTRLPVCTRCGGTVCTRTCSQSSCPREGEGEP